MMNYTIGAMMIFKQLITNIWSILDVLFFIACAVAFNCGGFYFGQGWGYLTLAITFLLAGLLVEQIEDKRKGGGEM